MQTGKIIYNNCYGGFSLSTKAIEHYLTLRGLTFRKKPDEFGWSDAFYIIEDGEETYFSDLRLSRTDPLLIQTLETIGLPESSGKCASLAFHELPKGSKYRIMEYDGNEWIETPEDIAWETI